MIQLRDVTVALPAAGVPRTVLSGVSAAFRRGGWYAVAGANGSGKTTLLAVIAGLIAPSSGEVTCDSVPPSIALLLQEPDNQFVTTSVAHELELAAAAPMEIAAAVDRFRLGEFLARNPHELSGGEKQRLAFATVWLQKPELLLLDEPTSFLDPETYDDCVTLLREMNAAGTTIVWATPGGEEVSLAEETVYLLDGRLAVELSATDGTPWASPAPLTRTPVGRLAAEIVAAVERAEGRGVLDPAVRGPLLAADTVETLATAVASLATRMGPALDPADRAAAPSAAAADETACSFRSVDFGYGDHPVLENIDLDIRRGECVGVGGSNGAGKTTLLALAGGVLRPSRGKIQRPQRAAERQAGAGGGSVHVHDQDVFYLFQSPERLFFAETVEEEIAFGLIRSGMPRELVRARAEASLTEVELDPALFLERSPFRLSFGEMRRVAFAVALSLAPRMLLLDEPTSCLDDDGRDVLVRILARYRAEGRAVAIASHDVDFLAAVCDRIVFLKDRRVADELRLDAAAPPQRWPVRRPAIIRLQEQLREAGYAVPWTTRVDRLVHALVAD